MRSISALIMAGLVCLGGCATPIRNPASTQSSEAKPVIVSPESPDNQRRRQSAASAGQRNKQPLAVPPRLVAPQLEVSPIEEPDAVVKLDPKSGTFTHEMDARLAKIADEVTKDDRLMIRLESYVPGGGSTALDIGIADKVLHKVRERLQTLGVPTRRMLLSSYGGEHSLERDVKRYWVEIYVIRPDYPSDKLKSGSAHK